MGGTPINASPLIKISQFRLQLSYLQLQFQLYLRRSFRRRRRHQPRCHLGSIQTLIQKKKKTLPTSVYQPILILTLLLLARTKQTLQ